MFVQWRLHIATLLDQKNERALCGLNTGSLQYN